MKKELLAHYEGEAPNNDRLQVPFGQRESPWPSIIDDSSDACSPQTTQTVNHRLTLTLLLAALFSGCHAVKTAVDIPAQTVRAVTPGLKSEKAVDPVEVQQTLLRFADEFANRMVIGVEKLRRGTNDLDQADLLRWKITLSTETCSIVSGPNAIANLLDMTVFVTVTRMALEDHWLPKVFGESARPMLDGCRKAETEIWQLIHTVLKPAQQEELRKAIENWHKENPLPESVLAARALGFASRVAELSREEPKPGSVFSLLKVDPFAGMDPAVREIAQTRLFAERALYVTQKMPMLLRWQTELLTVNAVEMPAVQQLVTNSTQIAASVDRFARVAEQLPAKVTSEREELVKALEAQEKGLTPLLNEARQTLAAGTEMSTSLNTTLTTFDALMKRFGVGDTNNATPPGTNSEPFRIQDYGQTAAQLGATARQLTELLLTLDRTLGSSNITQLSVQAGPVVQQAQSSGKQVVDYAFRKAVLFLVILLAAILGYRLLAGRLALAKPSKAPLA